MKLLPHEKKYIKTLATHSKSKCAGRHCCIHNPSDHNMRSWKLNYRFDKQCMERICPQHGIGHPDPDDLEFQKSINREHTGIHGCCGCCSNKNN